MVSLGDFPQMVSVCVQEGTDLCWSEDEESWIVRAVGPIKCVGGGCGTTPAPTPL